MSPKEACEHAKKYGPSEKTRKIACESPPYAYEYAEEVDKCPREDTREAACQDSWSAVFYAQYVDKCPREDTRKAACKKPYYAYLYAKYIDKKFHEDTWEAVKGTEYEKEYNYSLNQIEKEKII